MENLMPAISRVILKAFDKARTLMVLDHPWWGSLALRLRATPNNDIDTAATDGVRLVYSEEFFEALTPGRRITVIAHEVMHCALSHMTRRGSRDPELWNKAADHVINLELKANGFEAMDNFSYKGQEFKWLCDPRFNGMSTEQVYAILEKEKLQGGGKGKGQQTIKVYVWDFGHVNDAPRSTEEQPMSPQQVEEDWKIAVQEATEVAKKAGTLPRGMERITERVKKSRNDWRDVLRRYISQIGDYSWTRPNRRFVGDGIYLPGTVKARMRSLVFVVDTSGSIDGEMLQMAAAELENIFLTEERPQVINVLYHDTKVQHAHEVEGTLEFEGKGGGGTAFQSTLDYVEEQGLNPDILFWFTDLMTSDHPEAPEYPVVFLVPEEYEDAKFHFGEIVPISKY